jgi:CRP/FNR family transcriptional regulator
VKSFRDASLRRPRSTASNVIPLRQRENRCSDCPAREFCLPARLADDELRIFAENIDGECHLREAEVLYRAGDPFKALYAIFKGALKISIPSKGGREQVAGYYLRGEIVGFDGIACARHTCRASALEDAIVCAIPFARLEELARAIPALQKRIYRMLAREVSRNRNLISLFGIRDGQVRLVSFLLDMSERSRQRDHSANELKLLLSHAEIGSYLALSRATVSSALSRLQAAGLMHVQGHRIKLLDLPYLKRLVGNDLAFSPA